MTHCGGPRASPWPSRALLHRRRERLVLAVAEAKCSQTLSCSGIIKVHCRCLKSYLSEHGFPQTARVISARAPNAVRQMYSSKKDNDICLLLLCDNFVSFLNSHFTRLFPVHAFYCLGINKTGLFLVGTWFAFSLLHL